MFITAVCVLFLLKLRWPRKKIGKIGKMAIGKIALRKNYSFQEV